MEGSSESGLKRERFDNKGRPSSDQHSPDSLRGLATRFAINQKTNAKTKQRTSAADIPTGPSLNQTCGIGAPPETSLTGLPQV